MAQLRKLTRAELLVKERADLVKKISAYRGWMSHMKVTRKTLIDVDEGERTHRFFRWRKDQYRDERDVPPEVESAFYRFIGDEAVRLERRQIEIERELEAMSRGASDVTS